METPKGVSQAVGDTPQEIEKQKRQEGIYSGAQLGSFKEFDGLY